MPACASLDSYYIFRMADDREELRWVEDPDGFQYVGDALPLRLQTTSPEFKKSFVSERSLGIEHKEQQPTAHLPHPW